MPDRKDVIKGIEQCLIGACKPCPYYSNDASCGCKDKLMEDTLTLLKARKTKYYEDWGLVPVSVEEALTMWQKEQEAR